MDTYTKSAILQPSLKACQQSFIIKCQQCIMRFQGSQQIPIAFNIRMVYIRLVLWISGIDVGSISLWYTALV